jgi:hypothetical protein
MNDYSQHGESKILKDIFDKIGTFNNYGIEFGASDGFYLSNFRMFLETGWKGLQLDGLEDEKNEVKKEFITKENINLIFDKYEVPQKFDLLSIDIDGNDYWVWENINRNPNVVIIEYNSNFEHNKSVSLNYKENRIFDGTYAYGASLAAMEKLAKKKGYYLYTEVAFNNLIFIREEFFNKLPPIYNKDLLCLPFKQHKQELTSENFFVEV